MTLKPGVRLLGVKNELVVAMMVANSIHGRTTEQEMVVTSVVDGTHRKGSLHYAGLAFDIRTITLDAAVTARFVAELEKALWNIDFDVLFENPGTDNEHVHVEYQPKDPL